MPLPSAHLADIPESEIASAFSWFRFPTATGAVGLMLVGELDLATAERAREAVRQAQDDAEHLICDLGDVWFVDLAGLRVLLDAAALAKQTGARFTVTDCPIIVSRMLQVLALEDALDVEPTPRTGANSPTHLRLVHTSA